MVTICYKKENDFNGEFASVQNFVSTNLFLCTFISFKVQGECWGKVEGSGVLPIYICGWGKAEGSGVLPIYMWLGKD